MLLGRGDAYYKRVAELHDYTASGLQQDIEAFYQRFATENGLTYAQAQQAMTSREREKYQMTLKEYVDKASQLTPLTSPEWKKEIDAASITARITRLQGLQISMRQRVEELSTQYDGGMKKLAAGIIEDGYYRNIFELQKASGMATTFTQVNQYNAQALAAQPWTADGRTFSDRIWTNRNELAVYLNAELGYALTSGRSPRNLVQDVMDKFNVSKGQAARLISTESAYFSSASQRMGFEQTGVKYFHFHATYDEKTCEQCGELNDSEANKKGFPMELYAVGQNAPPLHCFCRCVLLPGDDDVMVWADGKAPDKWARDADGQSISIPDDMTYSDWRKEYAPKLEVPAPPPPPPVITPPAAAVAAVVPPVITPIDTVSAKPDVGSDYRYEGYDVHDYTAGGTQYELSGVFDGEIFTAPKSPEDSATVYIGPKSSGYIDAIGTDGNKKYLVDNSIPAILENGVVIIPDALAYDSQGYSRERYTLNELITAETGRLGGAIKKGEFWRGTNNKNEPELITAGKLHKSVNHMTNEKEDGLSVFPKVMYYNFDYMYKVAGDIVGYGSDGEPLLDIKSLKVVDGKMVDPHKRKDELSKLFKKGEELFLKKYKWTRVQLDSAKYYTDTKLKYIKKLYDEMDLSAKK